MDPGKRRSVPRFPAPTRSRNRGTLADISLPISFRQLLDQFIDVHSDPEEIGFEFKHIVHREQNLNDRALTLWLRGGFRSVDKIQHLNDELIPLGFPKRSI